MKSIAFFFFLLSLPACAASISGIRLDDGSMKSEYARSERVTIGIVNDGKSAIDFYANAEILDEGEWVTWPYEIEHGTPEGLSILHHVLPGKTTWIKLNFSEISPPPVPDGVRPSCNRIPYFRFRVVVAGPTKEELYSEPFKVVDPYGACSEDGVFKATIAS